MNSPNLSGNERSHRRIDGARNQMTPGVNSPQKEQHHHPADAAYPSNCRKSHQTGRDGLIRTQRQDRQQTALLPTPKWAHRVAIGDLKRAEDPKLHLVSTPFSALKANRPICSPTPPTAGRP